ncbi:MAG: hypothetical protein ACO1QS_20260 [Verrucomicrobiota bacterium]
MAGKAGSIMKGLFVLALIGGAVWAGLRYKEEAIQAWQKFRTPKPVAVEVQPAAAGLLDASLSRAQASGKLAVIRFNLTDCAVCERMSRDVFTQPEWGKFAAEKLEITEYLMPTTFTSEQPELVQRMELLDSFAKASGAGQGFPFVAVLAKDGSLLGARAGYQGGGAGGYIRWIEQLGNADKSTPKKIITPATETKSKGAPAPATPVAAKTVPNANSAATSTSTNAPAVLEITVKGISGTGSNKMALIGVGKRNVPLLAGEKKKVPWDKGSVTVECREIGDKEVVVQVEGEPEARRLSLPLN